MHNLYCCLPIEYKSIFLRTSSCEVYGGVINTTLGAGCTADAADAGVAASVAGSLDVRL